jgi:hypothetical protein
MSISPVRRTITTSSRTTSVSTVNKSSGVWSFIAFPELEKDAATPEVQGRWPTSG